MIKKHLLTLLFLGGLAQTISAQCLPNPSFDSVYFGGIDRVFEWITSDGILLNNGFYNDTVNNLQPNTCFDASGFHTQK